MLFIDYSNTMVFTNLIGCLVETITTLQVPRQECNQVERQECRNIPRELCNKVNPPNLFGIRPLINSPEDGAGTMICFAVFRLLNSIILIRTHKKITNASLTFDYF